MMKVDLHVHSNFSSRPSEWILQKLKCPESFTKPADLYAIAKKRGMTHVTITDHNDIGGCLEILHLPDTFMSVEVTSYFPEDGCKLHVLVYGLSENQFHEIQKIRRSVYDLVAYLNEQNILHALAHPLFSINGKLTYDHFERLLLLFRNFELNGSRNEELNDVLKLTASVLTPEVMAELMERHRLVPPYAFSWTKNFVGGSDDHSSLHIADRWTAVEGAETIPDFFYAIAAGRAEVQGSIASPEGFARNLYSIAWQFYRKKLNLESKQDGNLLFNALDSFLLPSAARGMAQISLPEKIRYFWDRKVNKTKVPMNAPIFDLFKGEMMDLFERDPSFAAVFKDFHSTNLGEVDAKWCEIITIVSNKLLSRFNTEQLRSLFNARFLDLITTLGSIGMLYFILAPYFLAFSLFSKDIRFSRGMARRILKRVKREDPQEAKEKKVAHFTDTFSDLNGVARTIRKQLDICRATGKDYTVVTCDPLKQKLEGVRNFSPIGTFKFEEYRDQKVCYPPYLEILSWCYRQNFTHIHVSTPGPVGLAAVGVASALSLPIIGTYHTSFPQYAKYLTEDNGMEGMLWKYMLWFYQQMTLVLVPSKATADELIGKGLAPEKIRIFPRGVDSQLYHPDKANGYFKNKEWPDTHKVLYAGRVSKEKNTDWLEDWFKKLSSKRSDITLVIAGTGPCLESMRKNLAGYRVLFLGSLESAELAHVYASSDLFVFPSTTDTFGNVVLEAQASGLPVIVTDKGGPQENVIAGVTGYIHSADDQDAWLKTADTLLSETCLRRKMSEAAREFAAGRSFEKAFEQTWKLYDLATLDESADFPEDTHGIPDEIAERLVSSVNHYAI